ncbi:plasmid replication initiator RepA [Salmonella enterica]|uniref:plasmid replication initiator RepA n=1 Tax=Salmonella enterica TaxID=28901 RepID=UPI0007C80537|nr:plasmid replication initiator RepA [Salmonella enterica]OAG95557.1 RepA [Salmonella enterica subsp. enterica serovar Nottingham]
MPLRSTYVCNADPKFQVPKHHTHKLPFVLSDALQRLEGRDLTCEIAFYVNQPATRKRRINEHRRRAINAVIAALLHHTNIISKRVLASAEALADFCGLSTVSKAGNKSITRCTRALAQLKLLGFINYERRWDRVNKQYWPAKIEIRDQMLETVGITDSAWRRAVSQKLNYFNAKNSKKIQKAVTEAEYKNIVIQEQMEHVWQQRKTAREIKAKQKAAARAARLAKEKGDAELRHQLTREVSQEFADGLYPGADLQYLKSLVEQRYNTLRKTWQSPQH